MTIVCQPLGDPLDFSFYPGTEFYQDGPNLCARVPDGFVRFGNADPKTNDKGDLIVCAFADGPVYIQEMVPAGDPRAAW